MAGGAMDKSPDAFRTISEVAEELDLPQHVLRFWETRFSHIKPLKRGGGRRYYRPDDIDLLKGIRHFLYGEGYTIRGVQRILKEEGIRFVQAIGRGEEGMVLPRPEAKEPLVEDIEGFEASEDREAVIIPSESLLSDEALRELHAALEELIEGDRVLRSLKSPAEAVAAD
jgi:DNA-binding transcriptional MerR regulator